MPLPLVFIASDHRGFALKAKLLAWLAEHMYDAKDLGTHSEERCDAIDFVQRLATEMHKNDGALGVLICGTGQAMAMVANRYHHLRAVICADPTMARITREHNDANVLAIGSDVTGATFAVDTLETFLKTPFLGGRYAERRDKLTSLGGL